MEATVSSQIPTVALVQWRLSGVVARTAKIELSRVDDGATRIIPIPNPDESPNEVLLLGMKGSSRYTYTIDVNDGQCVSEPRELTTGAVPVSVPSVVFEVGTTLSPGFYILCSGFGPPVGTTFNAPSSTVYIIDQDGDPVWWWMAPQASSRATMDWEAEHMYMLALNVGGRNGGMYRVNMDGTHPKELTVLADGHHDFTVTPGGRVVSIVHAGRSDGVVEYDPETDHLVHLVEDVGSLYEMVKPEYHANSITYLEEDDAFILGDRYPSMYDKFDRHGQLQWQFGGANPRGPAFDGAGTWNANHGHHWTNGKMFVFNNQAIGGSPILEFDVDEENLKARRVRSIDSEGYASLVLGDVQQLPNGNILATYSMAGRLVEYSPEGNVVASVKVRGSLGYSMFRSSMYGPPDK